MLATLALALLPALGTLAGGLLSFPWSLAPLHLSYVLHLGAGVVLGVVGVELMPRAVQSEHRWLVLVAFVAGGVLYVVTVALADRVVARRGGGAGAGAVWGIVVGVALDLVTDGMMIAAGQAIGDGLGLLLVGEATQQGSLGDDFSLTDAVVVIVTPVGVDIGPSEVKEKLPALTKATEGLPLVILQDGTPIEHRMERTRVDRADILSAAREAHGGSGSSRSSTRCSSRATTSASSPTPAPPRPARSGRRRVAQAPVPSQRTRRSQRP